MCQKISPNIFVVKVIQKLKLRLLHFISRKFLFEVFEVLRVVQYKNIFLFQLGFQQVSSNR